MDYKKIGRPPHPQPQPEGNECNCCINVENSSVIIVCGDADPVHFKNSIKSIFEAKETAETDPKV